MTAEVSCKPRSRLLEVLERLVTPLIIGREDVSIWVHTDRAEGWVWRSPTCPST